MDTKRIADAGLHGWKGRVADRKTPASGDQVRAVLAVVFFLFSLVYVLRTIAELARQSRT